MEISNDGKYAIMMTSKDTEHKNLLAIRDISKDKFDKKMEFTPIVKDFIAEFSVIHTKGTKFYLHTNWNATKGKIVMFDFSNYDKNDPMKSF